MTPAISTDYKVCLEVFEGPLDLLLYLIKKDEVDIYDIPIERITTQYMEYLNLMRMLDLNIAGEFIVMAATLMLIKSRMLLPEDERTADEEEEHDPRWDLVMRLLEYKRFKEAADALGQMEDHQRNVFGAGGESILPTPDLGLAISDVGIFDLLSAFNEALRRARPEQIGEIAGPGVTVADMIEQIMNAIRARKTVPFFDLFRADAARQEIICAFLALLELIRLCQVRVFQQAHFAEIVVEGVL